MASIDQTRNRPTILVTGASSGLGLALALQLLQMPCRLVLTARKSSLKRFKKHGLEENDRLRLRAMDVTSDADRRRVVEEAEADWGGIDVLVNNAGVAYRSVVEHVNEEERLAQMDINFRSPMELIRLVLPGMRRKRSGRIVNISSVGGMMAMPTMAAYSASKFALEGATESLWYEVRPWGIKVSLVEPGFIHSTSFERTLYTEQSERSMHDRTDPYHAHYESMAGFIGKLMRRSRTTAADVARIIVKTITDDSPHLRVPATLDAHVFALLRRFLPRRLYHYCLYRALPGIKTWGPGSHQTRSGHAPQSHPDTGTEEQYLHP